MSYEPLTKEQYQSARNAGFTHDQIIANEQVRKQKESQSSVASKVGRFIGDVTGLSGLGRALVGKAQPIIKEGGLISPEGKLQQPFNIGGIQEAVGTGTKLGTTAAGFGVKAATAASGIGRIAQTGTKLGGISAVGGAGEAFSQGGSAQDIAKSAATSGAIGFGFGSAGQAISELTTLLTSPAVTEGLYNKALGIPKKVVEKGRSPAKMLLSEGIGGTKSNILSKSNTIATESSKQVDDILSASARQHNSKQIIQSIEKSLQEKFQNTLGQDEIKAIVDKLPLNKLRTSVRIDDKVLNAIRKELDTNFLGSAKWLNESSAERTLALKTATNVMRDIVKGADDRLPAIFDRWANAITATRSLRSELAKPHILSNMLELMTSLTVGGATGGLTPDGLKNAFATYAALNAAQSTPIKTSAARFLGGVGRAAGSAPAKVGSQLVRGAIPGISTEISK